jgi:hypothetical protein
MDTFPSEATEYAKDWDLPAKKQTGWVHELEVPLRAGESLAYDSEADAPAGAVAFNIHSHHGPEVTYHVRGAEPRVAGTFLAPAEGKFYLMWENTSAHAVRVRARATRR